MDDFYRTPYGDGCAAARRTEQYDGWKTIPPCPYAEGTAEYEDWQRGFEDATEMLWDPVIQGWVDD